MAGQLRLQFMVAIFSAWLAEALMQSGEFDRALDVARRAVQLANERNEPWARSVALRVLGQALALSTVDGAKLVERILRSAQGLQSSLGLDRQSVASGQGVAVRVTLGGGRIIKKKK